MRICCYFLAFLLLVSLLPYTALADAILPIRIGKVTDFDKLHQAFDYPSGVMVSSGGDFWIADSSASRPQSIAHVWESPGIMDMGTVDFNSVSEAPLTGYQGDVSVSEGHIYVTISRGRYGKFRIDDIIKPGDRAGVTVTEFSITYAYQPDGSRSLATGTPSSSASTTTTPTSTPAAAATATSTGSGVYENYKGSPDIGGDVRMQYWHGQTFTALSSHAVSGVRLMAYRIGTPGSLIVSIRAANSSGHPSGADLAYGSTSGDTLPLSLPGEWREITFTQPVSLTAGVKYALVVRAPGGGGGNVVKWQTDSSAPDYTGGARESSGDSGATWQTDTSADYLFEIIGSGPGTVPAVDTGGSSTAGGSTSSGSSTTSGGSSSTGSSTTSVGGGTNISLPPGVWTSWDSNTSQWVTIGPSQVCVDTTSNGYDMGAKTQRTYGTDCNYIVEFDFTMSQEGRVRMWQDGFAFVTLNFGNMITLMSGNYQSYEITKTKLSPNRWYRIRVAVIKDANPGYGKYDVYVDGQYAGSKTSSEFDMKGECGGKCILMGKWGGYTEDRTKCCWKNINVTVGGNPGTATGGGTGTTAGPAAGGGTGATTGVTTGTGTGTGSGTGTAAALTMLAAGSRTAVPNSPVQVPVNLTNAGSIGSMNFVVTYDPQVLKVNRVDGGSLVGGNLFTPNYQVPPEIRFGLAATGGINGSGSISYMEFQVIGNAGSSSPLKISELSVNNTSGQPVSVNSQDGLVTITGSKIKGDYNGDGKLSEVDALAALKMSVKLLAEDLALDLDGNGKVTAEDARLILKKALGK